MDPSKITIETTRKSVKGSAYEKDPVGLAIELIGMGRNPKEAIDTIKELQKAFS